MNRDWAAPASSGLAGTAPDGGRYALSDIGYFVHHLPYCDAMFDEILRRAIPRRYRLTAFSLPWLLSGNDRPIVRLQELRVMKNEKLKSTTVRFTDSDLHLIDCLQEKLGLGMIHVIRLAIRRLAEIENLLPSASTPSSPWCKFGFARRKSWGIHRLGL